MKKLAIAMIYAAAVLNVINLAIMLVPAHPVATQMEQPDFRGGFYE